MKRRVKRIHLLLITVMTMFLAYGIVSYAAEGTLQMSDVSGNVGGEITVPVSINAGGEPIGDGDITVNYDSSILEFVGGTNATAEDGVVHLSASGTGTETELNYTMVFKALAEGTTTLQVADSTAYLFSDETLYLTPASVNVTVGAADAQTTVSAAGGDAVIEVSGVQYSIYNDFTDALIPAGFSRSTINYNSADYNAIAQDASGIKFVYLKSGDSDPILAMYDEADNHFVQADQVQLTSSEYIYVLGEADASNLPATFGETTLDLNGRIFPVWQDSENKDFYLVSALGPSGEVSFYQYDTTDKTYQRYVERSTAKSTDSKEEGNLLDQIKNEISKNLHIITIVVVAIILIMLIIIIVLASKLRNVSEELDQLYDEYEEGDGLPKNKKTREQFIRKDDDYEMESDDYMEEDYDAYTDDEYDDYDEFDDYDDETYSTKPLPRKQSKNVNAKATHKKSSKKNYDIEFIDL